MKAYVFPGQGSQYEGMGRKLCDQFASARALFEQADNLLGFSLSDKMFHGSAADLKETAVAQPAIFLYSLATLWARYPECKPTIVAGHSLGELSALVAAEILSFEDGLKLVSQRAAAMQMACNETVGTMVAVLGCETVIIENICSDIEDVVVPANYNSTNEVVISGTILGVKVAMDRLKDAGARMMVPLQVGGAFHSPLMESAKVAFGDAIQQQNFCMPICPIYQNVSASAETDPDIIKNNILKQLAAPVRWNQLIIQMVSDGATEFVEVGGKGGILRNYIKQVDRKIPVEILK